MKIPSFVSVKEYAEYRGVHRNTIIKWIRAGRIAAEQPAGKRGRYAIPAEMIIARPDLPPASMWPKL